MAVIAVLVGLSAFALVGMAVLAFVVARLSGQLRELSAGLATAERRADAADQRALTAARQRPPAAPTPEPVPVVVPVPVAVPEPQPVAVAEEVAVITAIADGDDGLDITARRVASVTLARPLIKVASLSYGLRRALDGERRFKVRYAVRHEYRRQRKMRRRRRAGKAPSMGWRT